MTYRPAKGKGNFKDDDNYYNYGWNIENSIFRVYRRDTEKVLDEAFEHDYNAGKLKKFLSGDDEVEKKFQNILRFNYELIKRVYKYYSSFNPQKDVWCIS